MVRIHRCQYKRVAAPSLAPRAPDFRRFGLGMHGLGLDGFGMLLGLCGLGFEVVIWVWWREVGSPSKICETSNRAVVLRQQAMSAVVWGNIGHRAEGKQLTPEIGIYN